MSGIDHVPDDPLLGDALRQRAVLDALSRAVIVTRPDGEIVLWNRSAEELYGWSEAEVLGRQILDVLVPVATREQAGDVMVQVNDGRAWRGDFSVQRRDGDSRRIFVIDRPVLNAAGEVVGIVGVSEDVTEQRLMEQRSDDLTDRLALALDAGGLGTWRWDLATGVVEWDVRLEQLYGLEPGTFDGTYEAYMALLHPDDVEATQATVREATRTKSPYTVAHRVIWPDGSVHWVQGKGKVTLDQAGEVSGTIGCTADVTEQMELALEQERARQRAIAAAETERLSRERLQFLGEINDALARANSEHDVMRNVTLASVPRLGDWCAIFVVPESGSGNPEIEIAHVDPTMVEYARQLQTRFPYDPAATTGVPQVIRSGATAFFPEIDEQVLIDADATADEREVIQALALRSAITVPLVKRGRIIGAMQFVNSGSSRSYTESDVALAEAVAVRIASTIANLRLTANQKTIATTLQASLLPDRLPEIPGLDVAVRYWATGEGTEVGGDFYDVFEIDRGWAVVIGDVCGVGPQAASLTGLVRHTIRAMAWENASHEAVLRRVNDAVLRSGRATFCTALFATLTQTDRGFTFAMATGGHPLPIIHRASGTTEPFGTPGTLLGAYPDPRSFTVTTDLAPGDTVVLYTDGITDVRPPHDLDADALNAIVARAAGAARSATDVVDGLGAELSAILPIEQRNDDIAILALKVAPDEKR